MSYDAFESIKESYHNTQAAQQRAFERHKAFLKCNKCENRPYCHTVTPNCGAFKPKC